MTSRRHDDADFPTRADQQVNTPDTFADWRTYAFSETPEFVDDLDEATIPADAPTV